MKSECFWIFFMLAVVFSFQSEFSQASVVASLGASLGREKLDPRKPTHILVVGHAKGRDDGFLLAAVARARRYRELYPRDQVVVIAASGTSTANDLADRRFSGFEIITNDQNALSAPRALKQLLRFSQIE